MISSSLAKKFWDVIEISNLPWSFVDNVGVSEPNILRPIKGICFEEMFRTIIRDNMPGANFRLGPGDSDVDIYLNGKRLQLKTIDKGSTKEGSVIGVALHKTHGHEKRPHNLYKVYPPSFDFLVVLHPSDGILIIPHGEIPRNNNWEGYLSDPAIFDWESRWLNRWDLLGFPQFKGRSLENRTEPSESQLPKLSRETHLKDYQIIRALCRPEYFRAAVMGLKGNIKEYWMIDTTKKAGYHISVPNEPYSKYDFKVIGKNGREVRVQVKGTSKNMCDPANEKLGVEVMGTHGRFPKRGYKKSDFDYLAVVVSENQINMNYPIKRTLHFLFMPVSDLPLHYLIGNGIDEIETGWRNKDWNLPEYKDVIYPNIKLRTKYNSDLDRVEVYPDISLYGKYHGFEIIDPDSDFRVAGPYILDELPNFNEIDDRKAKNKKNSTLEDF